MSSGFFDGSDGEPFDGNITLGKNTCLFIHLREIKVQHISMESKCYVQKI